jgi:uncharacterized protein (TIGR02453 family)
MQLKPLFTYLSGLTQHNERAWFQTNKPTYDQLRAQFELDVEYWFAELTRLDEALAGPGGRKTIFRLHRDVRFSHDKTPYKTHFSAFFTASSKEIDSPSYYVQVGPHGQTLIGGGLYQPDKAQLAAVRQEIDYNAELLYDLLAAPNFQHYFPELAGEKLKRAPTGYPSNHADVELLKHKNFIVTHVVPDATVLAQPDMRAYVLDAFATMVPFCQYLRHALG